MNKDYSLLGSTLGSSYFGKLPTLNLNPKPYHAALEGLGLCQLGTQPRFRLGVWGLGLQFLEFVFDHVVSVGVRS